MKRDRRVLGLLAPDMDSFRGDDDPRPATSPYGGTLFQLYFKGQGPLYMPNRLLKKSPTFADRHCKEDILHLEDVSLDAGHVMVHFLYTGTYQCLKPEGQSPQDERIAEFATSVRVFSMARVYRLPTLRHLATREIQRLGDDLSLPCIVDVLQDVHSNLCDEDEWLETYLASRTRSELNTLDRPRAEALLLEIGCVTTINKVLLSAVVGRELEQRQAPAQKTEYADRVLAAHSGLIKHERKAGSARIPPSVDYIELESSVEWSPEAEEPPEEKPAEEIPAEVAWSAGEEKPAEDVMPVEALWPAEEEKLAEDEMPAAEEECYERAKDDFCPPAEIPPAEDEKPAAEDEKPAAEDEKPAAEDEKPAAEDEKPAAEDERPAAEECYEGQEQATPSETFDKNCCWPVVLSSGERAHLRKHLRTSGWRRCMKCAEYVSKLSQELQAEEK